MAWSKACDLGHQDACGLLGLDPLYVANEGKLLAVVAPEDADRVLAAMRAIFFLISSKSPSVCSRTERIEAVLGWQARTSLEDGIAAQVAWHRSLRE